MSGIPEATLGILTTGSAPVSIVLARSRRGLWQRARIVLLAANGIASRAIGRAVHHRYGLEVAGPLCREAACGSRRNGRSGRRAEVYGGDEQTHPDAVGSSAPAGCCAGRCRCPVYLALPACAKDRPCRAQILVREQRSRVRRQGCRRGRAIYGAARERHRHLRRRKALDPGVGYSMIRVWA